MKKRKAAGGKTVLKIEKKEGHIMDEQAGIEVKTEGAASTVKQGVISSLRGLGEIESEIVALVRNTVSRVL